MGPNEQMWPISAASSMQSLASGQSFCGGGVRAGRAGPCGDVGSMVLWIAGKASAVKREAGMVKRASARGQEGDPRWETSVAVFDPAADDGGGDAQARQVAVGDAQHVGAEDR